MKQNQKETKSKRNETKQNENEQNEIYTRTFCLQQKVWAFQKIISFFILEFLQALV